MMGNRMKGAGNGKRRTENGKRKNEKWEQKQRIGNENTDIGLRFQPRSQGSLLHVPTDSRRVGERTWERVCWGSS